MGETESVGRREADKKEQLRFTFAAPDQQIDNKFSW